MFATVVTCAAGVVSVDVDPIDRVGHRRAWSHVREEGIEAFPPPGAKANASTPVALVPLKLRVLSAAYHVNPRLILYGACHAVRDDDCADSLIAKAAT